MLTVTIFATIVAEMLPVSNNTPLIGQLLIKFCCILMVDPFFPSYSMFTAWVKGLCKDCKKYPMNYFLTS